MKLIDVLSASHRETEGVMDLVIIADLGGGSEELPFTYVPGDPFGLGPAVAGWLAAHPDFPVAPYVPPPPTPELTPGEKLDQLLSRAGLTKAELKALLK